MADKVSADKVSATSPGGSGLRALPLPGGGLAPGRRVAAFALTALGLPALTVALVALRQTLALESVLLLYLLAVVIVSVVGGMLPAILAAIASFLLANWFLTPPYHTFVVEHRDSVIALVVFLVVALTVSVTVDLAERRRVAVLRSDIQAEMLSRFTAEPVAAASLDDVLGEVQRIFGLDAVALLERRGSHEREVARVGPPLTTAAVTVEAGPGLRLVGAGRALFAEDRRVLGSLAHAAGRAVEGRRLADEAAQGRALAEVDRLRAALLAAVSHDLRTPLTGVKAAVSSLRQQDVEWTAADRQEFLATIEESADRLAELIANLLDMSRLQAGAVIVDLRPIALDEVVAKALIGSAHDRVEVTVPDDLPFVLADPGLLERAVANLVDNARRHSPTGASVRVEADQPGDREAVRLRVIDHGPGVPNADRERMFAPFQRLGDRSEGGVGLGLAIARGFTHAMGGSLTPSETPGGGLTMTVSLKVAE